MLKDVGISVWMEVTGLRNFSYLCGRLRPDSDVDILVALDYNQPIGLRFFGMYEDLKDLLGRNVDLVSDRTLAPFARESADHDKKLIYERTA